MYSNKHSWVWKKKGCGQSEGVSGLPLCVLEEMKVFLQDTEEQHKCWYSTIVPCMWSICSKIRWGAFVGISCQKILEVFIFAWTQEQLNIFIGKKATKVAKYRHRSPWQLPDKCLHGRGEHTGLISSSLATHSIHCETQNYCVRCFSVAK